LLALSSATNAPAAKDQGGLRNTTVLIIRHAEKPPTGFELTPAGIARANAYTNYFKDLRLDGKPVKLEHLFAAADSANSHRSRLTLEPLARVLAQPLDQRFATKQGPALADELRAKPHGAQILICWHHNQVANLLTALGADPAKLLPNGQWPDEVFNWMIELRFDAEGHLPPGAAKCVNENLMPGDAAKAPPAS